LDFVLDLNYFSFSNPNINPNPTLLPEHQTLNPNQQFYQRILYVEHYSVHVHMAGIQKFRQVRNFAWHWDKKLKQHKLKPKVLARQKIHKNTLEGWQKF